MAGTGNTNQRVHWLAHQVDRMKDRSPRRALSPFDALI